MTIDRRHVTFATLALGLAAAMPTRASADPVGSTPAPATPAPAGPTPAPVEPAIADVVPTPLRIGYTPVMGAAALFVLARSRMAAKAGLAITLVRLDAAASLVPPPLEGRYDALAVGVAPLAAAKSAGADVKIVASLATAGSGLVAVPALAAQFDAARYDPGRALAAFKAKAGRVARIATTTRGVLPSVLLEHWLFKLHAVPPDLVELVPMDLAALAPAVGAGTVDGAMLPEPASTILRAKDPTIQRIIAGSAMFPDAPGLVIGVSGAFARDHEATVRALVQGLVGATRHIRQDIAKSATYVQEGLGLPETDRPLVARALISSNIGFITDPHAIEQGTRAMLAFEAERGDYGAGPDIEGLFDDAFYPGSVRSSTR